MIPRPQYGHGKGGPSPPCPKKDATAIRASDRDEPRL